MKLTNERPCEDIVYDIEMSDGEVEFLVKYGKDNITDEALIQFAMVDILIKQMDRAKVQNSANLVNDVLANAAELGCPKEKSVDMWYRELTDTEQCDILEHLTEITGLNYSE